MEFADDVDGIGNGWIKVLPDQLLEFSDFTSIGG